MLLTFLYDGKELKDNLSSLEKQYNFLTAEWQRKSFLGKNGADLQITGTEGKPDVIYIQKVKADESLTADYFRNFLAGFIPSLKDKGISILNIIVPAVEKIKDLFQDEKYLAQSIAEGVYYGNYSFDKYKSDAEAPMPLEVIIIAKDNRAGDSGVFYANLIMKGVNYARDLQNEPSSNLSPSDLAESITRKLKKERVKVAIFDEKELTKRKMGGILAVGRGSKNPPRLIVMNYAPATGEKLKLKKIALVGKGVTFDSGGISLKPAANMGEMKADMSGAAVVAGTILAAAASNLPVEITGIIPAVENMPSGSSYKPGDIVRTASGKTIEIDNTDAEGRVALSDALDYASKLKPDMIIDLATLTGAVVVALGEFVAGLFTKDEKLADELYKSGLKTYDRVWRLPLWDEYSKLNKSDVADVKNSGGRWGGAVSAAKFLEVFVDKNVPWAHIDIAGPAIANDFNNYTKPYMTGFGVRLLFDFLINISTKS
jgi:leucyl aminopeptidase